jgi:hypothetical protein
MRMNRLAIIVGIGLIIIMAGMAVGAAAKEVDVLGVLRPHVARNRGSADITSILVTRVVTPWATYAAIILVLFWFIVAILLCVWVYRDAKVRGENATLWLIIVLIAGIIGLIIWLIVRPKKKVT